MKRRIILSATLAVLFFCAAIGVSAAFTHFGSDASYTTMEERTQNVYNYKVGAMADVGQYSYDEMRSSADIIAIAQVNDELSAENSYITEKYDEKYKSSYISNWKSERKIDAVSQIKGEVTDDLSVEQLCAMTKNGEVTAYTDCYPMIKGDVYAIYMLKQDGGENVYYPMSIDNGIIDLSYLALNRRSDLAAMTAIDLFDAEFPDEIREAYLKSREPGNLLPEKQLQDIYWSSDTDWNTVQLTTPYTIKGMEINVEYTQKDGVWYFRTGDILGYYDGTTE